MSRPFTIVTLLRLLRTIFSTTTSGFSWKKTIKRAHNELHKTQNPYLVILMSNTFFFTLPPGKVLTSSSDLDSDVLPANHIQESWQNLPCKATKQYTSKQLLIWHCRSKLENIWIGVNCITSPKEIRRAQRLRKNAGKQGNRNALGNRCLFGTECEAWMKGTETRTPHYPIDVFINLLKVCKNAGKRHNKQKISNYLIRDHDNVRMYSSLYIVHMHSLQHSAEYVYPGNLNTEEFPTDLDFPALSLGRRWKELDAQCTVFIFYPSAWFAFSTTPLSKMFQELDVF